MAILLKQLIINPRPPGSVFVSGRWILFIIKIDIMRIGTIIQVINKLMNYKNQRKTVTDTSISFGSKFCRKE